MISTVGLPFFKAASNEMSCIEQNGFRVQIGFTPRGLDDVGEATTIAFSPAMG